jgi:hypothetical protein
MMLTADETFEACWVCLDCMKFRPLPQLDDLDPKVRPFYGCLHCGFTGVVPVPVADLRSAYYLGSV